MSDERSEADGIAGFSADRGNIFRKTGNLSRFFASKG